MSTFAPAFTATFRPFSIDKGLHIEESENLNQVQVKQVQVKSRGWFKGLKKTSKNIWKMAIRVSIFAVRKICNPSKILIIFFLDFNSEKLVR
jgi:hypothetical protein